MIYEFIIEDVIKEKLYEIKVDVYDNSYYEKTLVLFDIWATQKRLGYLFDTYKVIEKRNKGIPCSINLNNDSTNIRPSSYKEQYIEFIMKHNLIFLVEEDNTVTMLHLIFFWLLTEVKKDKKILDSF